MLGPQLPFTAILLASRLLTVPPATAGESDSGLTADEKKAGFVSLFNGENLQGWQQVQGKPITFGVHDGVIVGRRNREAGSAYWLSTNKEYGDFELRVQYLLQKGGNSGVFIRAPHRGRTSREGMEIQLRDDGANQGKPDKGSTGAVYSVAASSKFVARPAGEWNDLQIRCAGDRIQVTLNGERINDVSMADHAALKKRPRSGYIGLSAHTKPVMFRHVRIRVLEATGSSEPGEKAAIDLAAPAVATGGLE